MDSGSLDPRVATLKTLFAGRPAGEVPRTSAQREAAVSVLVRPRDRMELLLIRRAVLPSDPWSGHVALPGGRRSAGDVHLLDTARREAEEEVGVPLRRVGTFLGALDELTPGSPLLPPIVIAPFVLAVPADTEVRPDPREVQAALWVPVDALRDERAAAEMILQLENDRRSFPAYSYEDFVVWGLTYRIIRQFLELTAP